ncbi:MAG: hypothetical protein FWH01_07905 [Oscillospiraceae bacterium]|nr:hypothetical protein [Oscillospiraceae bacterium]
MKRNYLRVVSIFMAAFIVISLAGCGGGGGGGGAATTAAEAAATTAAQAAATQAQATTAAAAAAPASSANPDFDGKSRIKDDRSGIDSAWGQMEIKEVTEPVTVSILRAWNGSSSTEPLADADVVAPILKEKFNITFDWEFMQGSETEKLTLTFASGNLPDAIDFPLWGGYSGETGVVKKAFNDGMLRTIDGYLETYAPSVAEKMFKNCSEKYLLRELENPLFDGYHYFIPRETMFDPEKDVINWLYGVYIRKDIAEAVGFDNAKDMKTPDDMLDLMAKIKEGGFKDINGNDVVVASTGSRGFSFDYYLRFFDKNKYIGSLQKDPATGKIRYDAMMREEQLDRLAFVRKMVNNGYLDPECFTQENAQVDVKMNNGTVAMISNQGMALITNTTDLVASHPEMEYVPIAIPNSAGEVYSGIGTIGRDGTPAWLFTENMSDDQLIVLIQVMDYLNTLEGQTLITYGVEGKTFEYVDDFPQYLPEYQDYANNNMRKLTEMGFAGGTGSGEISAYGIFVVADTKPFANKKIKTTQDLRADAYRDIIPLKMKPIKMEINFWNNDYPLEKTEEFNLVNGDFSKIKQQAYFATSDSESIKILEDWWNSVEPVYMEFEAFINEQVDAYDGELELLY